jgi:hypothetical protein
MFLTNKGQELRVNVNARVSPSIIARLSHSIADTRPRGDKPPSCALWILPRDTEARGNIDKLTYEANLASFPARSPLSSQVRFTAQAS